MKNFVLNICILLFLTSCEDVLKELPKSIAEETFYNTEAEIESAIAAIYAPLHNVYSSEFIPLLESSTDYQKGGGSYAPNSEFQGLNSTNMNRSGTKWDYFYLAIRNANLVITNVEKNEVISQELKTSSIAEARFMRGMVYFQLAKCWGGVVLRTEDNMDEINVPRTTEEEIYKLIKEDLLYAEVNLPDNYPVAGRASKWAAKTVLADVYFYTGSHSEAAEKANEVIQSGKFSLIEVVEADDFSNVFGPNVVTSPEEILYIKYNTEQTWSYPFFTHAIGSPYLTANGYGGALWSEEHNPVYANWDENDLRKSYGWYKTTLAFGTNTILNKKFSDAINPRPTNDYPLYRYADILLLYAEASCEAAGKPTEEGLLALNQVHRRAYGYTPLLTSAADFNLSDYTKDSFIELVRKERGYETQSEGKRWFDLKRTGEPEKYIKPATGKSVAEKHLLWPIPVSEMNYNEALDPAVDQNPGY
ncbi:RagB/SusD family nutrient uptake outer membrane protein [uncultured Arcticibacterium sp.]|uniref:RagB/SusD family nutrient uptake outer membrane protein n=1 Tax=uncultured Arcticibacterium sp. TaxID=2173042 RepID=UPI0030F77D5D